MVIHLWKMHCVMVIWMLRSASGIVHKIRDLGEGHAAYTPVGVVEELCDVGQVLWATITVWNETVG